MRYSVRLLVGLTTVVSVSACMHVARVFLDMEEEENSADAPGQIAAPDGFIAERTGPEEPPLPIEGITNADSLLALLPTDAAGGVDWMAALDEGIIRPRVGDLATPDSVQKFGYDLYLNRGGGPEAFFPHSKHQEWLSCQSCHPQVYRNGAESLTPETAHEPTSCAFCHGSVAFPIEACERCHAAGSDLPQGRLEKSLGAVLTMERSDSTEFSARRRRTGIENLELVTAYPPARFPHGEHRLRFQCRACHEQPFSMQRGTSVLTEQEAHGGGACGACHNGTVAFETGINDCYRCHAETTTSGA